jgi:hypothetical protein
VEFLMRQTAATFALLCALAAEVRFLIPLDSLRLSAPSDYVRLAAFTPNRQAPRALQERHFAARFR